MNDKFISIIKKVISDRGKNVVNNPAVFNSLLADYARGEYAGERRLFIRELKTKPFDELMRKYEPPKPQPPVKQPVQRPKNNAANAASNDDYDDDDEDYDDFIEDDDEGNDYAETSGRPVRRSGSGNPGAYLIKCPRCGEVGEITDSRDLRSRHLGYICPRCGNDFIIEFFGTCRSCREKTGFNAHRLGTIITAAGIALLDAFTEKPKGILGSIGDAIKETYPHGAAAGECTFCKQIHIECPKCRAAVKFPHNKRIDKDVVRCPDCGQKMWHP